MRRPRPDGLEVGGTWTITVRAEIDAYELAFILEVPEEEVRDLIGERIPIRVARDLLRDLARQGRLDEWREAALFAHVIAGRRLIDRAGNVFCADGRPISGPIQRRRQDMSLMQERPD